MDIYDAIKARRTIRNFSDTPIEAALIEKFIDAGLRAPSVIQTIMSCHAISHWGILGRTRLDQFKKVFVREIKYMSTHGPARTA